MADDNSLRDHLPHTCGVYIMRDAAMEVLYVGKAIDLSKRVSQYFNPNKGDHKTRDLVPLIRKIDYIPCASERESLIWERRLIQQYQPFFNVMWKDDKSYPYVKVTLGEDFPRIRVVRKRKRDGGSYFGPYPKVTPIRNLLKSLWKRRLFPLRPCDFQFSRQKPLDPRKIKNCLYYHTGECPAPCAEKISYRDYRRIAEDAVLFFKGHYAKLGKKFEKQMKAASAAMQYERAGQLRDNIEALEHMAERVRYREVRPESFLKRLDGSRSVTLLKRALGLKRPPHHIECFDISHLFGRETVASMVCFKGGQPSRDDYRKFKVKTVAGIDDFKSMREVVHRRYRRLKEEGSKMPDLILIDGGKGQLAAAREALVALKLSVPLASLAKRLEEVFLPGKPSAIRLKKDDPALHLLQHIRNEAHRFAVGFHRQRRKKGLF